MKSAYADAEAFVTKDGSIIRELMHPAGHGCVNQSLAEARVPAGESTFLHSHDVSEELYHIVSGVGMMTLGDDCFEIEPGDTGLISPGTPHNLRNTSCVDELVVLCCCSPSYSHEDTRLSEEP